MLTDFAVSAPRAELASLAAPRSSWLSVISHLDPKYGGLSAAVPQLASTLSTDCDIDVYIHAFCLPAERYQSVSHPQVPVSYWPVSRASWLCNRQLWTRFREQLTAAQGIHIHGLWEQSTLAAARTARSLGKPYVLSAHGMLEAWAITRSRAKKQMYAALFERANLEGAACLHALTKTEAHDYRAFGCTRPIAIIPNGVTIPENASPNLFFDTFPQARFKRILLFLGRLHEKKGVELLVRAWAQSQTRSFNSLLVLAGPAEDQTRARVEQLVEQLGLSRQVLFTGMLEPSLKWSALAAAEGFVLPSYSEGLSIAVLEAMGMGLPVIVTENCNLPEVASYSAGWQIRAQVTQLTDALDAWLRNSREANESLGLRGAALVRERYSWSRVAAQMAELYRWVEGGATPKTFELQGAGGVA